MDTDQLRFVAAELRRLAPAARTPDGGTSHDGRRAFQVAAELLERDLVAALATARVTVGDSPSTLVGGFVP